MPHSNPLTIVKALFAAILLAALAAVAGERLAPGIPLPTVLLYSAMGAAALFAILVVVTVASLTFRQFILRMGGTDTQWLWFSGEPKGLELLRSQGKVWASKPGR
jgi:hypothetical protein